jgi:hypothetical protein
VTPQVTPRVLVACLGPSLGMTWTLQALQPKLRQQAEEGHRLDEAWLAVHSSRQQRGKCPHCMSPYRKFYHRRGWVSRSYAWVHG